MTAKNTIKHTRKNNFHKAISKKNKCQKIWGDSDTFLDGILGKYAKGKIHVHEDHRKTNSDWYGKKNYKTSDRKRDESAFDKLREYADVYEYGTSDDSE